MEVGRGALPPHMESLFRSLQFLGAQQNDSAKISLWHAGCSFGIVVALLASQGQQEVGVKGETIR